MDTDHNTVRPSEKQLAWADLEFGMFCHFGPNTFLDQEWGEGTESPAVVNPDACDPRQWAAAARDAGMKYLVFTAKHHDGFCNWPTDTTDHCIRSSPWRSGRGDMIEMVAHACADEGLKFGLYCSPWDRHEPCYEDAPAYDRLYIRQWTELLTRYGDLVCVWLDGAGSAGHVYDWQALMDTIHQLQPAASVFSIGEPDYRWVGNEDGLAPDPCYNVIAADDDFCHEHFTTAYRAGFPHWCPAECDARLRANWFWHPDDLPSLKSLDRLVDIYRCSVGRGANLLLNVGPDNHGLLPATDVTRLEELGAELHRLFGTPVGQAHGPADRLEVRLDHPTAVNCTICSEHIAAGERIRKYRIRALLGGRWEALAIGTAIGHKKIDTFPTVITDAMEVVADRSDGVPIFRNLQVFSA
jgi:alpha-L-fucosidase